MRRHGAIALGLAAGILLFDAGVSSGHCRLDRDRLDGEQRRRVEEWDRAVSRAQDLMDLFEKAVNAVICSDLAESVNLTFAEHVECVLLGPDDAFEKLVNLQRVAVLRAASDESKQRIYDSNGSVEQRREFLLREGWGPYVVALERRQAAASPP